MSYVQRTSGNISGVFARPQPGYAEEELADDNAELLAYLNPPLTKAQRIATILVSKSIPMTRDGVWNAVLAVNALAYSQAPYTGRTPAEQLAYNRARNKYQRECEEMEAAIRVIELEP